MPDYLASDVVELYRDDRFKRLWTHFRGIEVQLQAQINEPSTPKDERELLVHLKQRLNVEVIGVVEQAIRILEKKAQLTSKGDT